MDHILSHSSGFTLSYTVWQRSHFSNWYHIILCTLKDVTPSESDSLGLHQATQHCVSVRTSLFRLFATGLGIFTDQ